MGAVVSESREKLSRLHTARNGHRSRFGQRPFELFGSAVRRDVGTNVCAVRLASIPVLELVSGARGHRRGERERIPSWWCGRLQADQSAPCHCRVKFGNSACLDRLGWTRKLPFQA
jgi:hypothetical protein